MADSTIHNLLSQAESVQSIAGQQVYLGKPETERQPPVVLVFRESKRPVRHSTGSEGTKFAEIAVVCIGRSYDEAKQLADAAEATLQGQDNGRIHVLDVDYEPKSTGLSRQTIREQFVLRCLANYRQ